MSDFIRVRVTRTKNTDAVFIEAHEGTACAEIALAAAHLLFSRDEAEGGRFVLTPAIQPTEGMTVIFDGGESLTKLRQLTGMSLVPDVVVVDISDVF